MGKTAVAAWWRKDCKRTRLESGDQVQPSRAERKVDLAKVVTVVAGKGAAENFLQEEPE